MNIKKIIGSTYGSAYILKKMPGTSSTIVIAIILFLLTPYITIFFLAFNILVTLFLGLYSLNGFKENDPKDFTLDETLAILIIPFFINTNSKEFLFSIILFRFFDILKPLGIKWIEKKTKKNRFLSVFLDDIIAVFYTLLIIKALIYVKIF
jgi:phosphatidylglycerophosphatase A